MNSGEIILRILIFALFQANDMGDDTLMRLGRAAATALNQPFGHQGKQPIY